VKATNRRCAQCRKKVPAESAVIGGLRSFCSVEHLIEFTRSERGQKVVKKAVKREVKKAKEKLKNKSDYRREAQAAFNAYVRGRDEIAGRGCISCGIPSKTVHGGAFDAGHYRSRGSAPHLAFHLWNCHLQCVKCNRYLSGNVADYRINLIKRLGIERVEQIENDNHPRNYTIEDYQRIKRIFTKRLRVIKQKSNK